MPFDTQVTSGYTGSMTDKTWTVALAGTGDVTAENAIALLDDWLPVEGVTLAFPKLPRNAKTLRAVQKWAEEEELHVLSEQSNLIDVLCTAAAKDGHEVYLVLAWDDTESSSQLLEQALTHSIPVKDLTRALDDLEFDDESKAEELAAEPVEEPAVEPEPGTYAAKAVQAIVNAPAIIAPQGVGLSEQPSLESLIRDIIRDEFAKLTAEPEKATVPVLYDEDGNYRLGGKGRPRKGETATHITPSEARALGLELDEDQN